MSNVIPYTDPGFYNRIEARSKGTRGQKYFKGLQSAGEFYVANENNIKKYSYLDGAITLVWESEDLPDLVAAPESEISDMFIQQDGSVTCIIYGGFDTGNPASVYRLAPDGSIQNESPNINGYHEGGLYLILDIEEKNIFSQIDNYPSGQIATLDNSLNILTKRAFSGQFNNQNFVPVINKNNRLFIVERGSSAKVYELNKNLDILNIIDLQDIPDINISRSREVCTNVTGDIIIPCSSNSNNSGYIVILDEELVVKKVLDGAQIGFNIDGGTGRTNVSTTTRGYIATCNGENNRIYLIDPVTETRLWTSRSNDWDLGTSAPKEIHADTFGNVVVATGSGSDPEYILVYDIEGTQLLNIALDSTAMAVHPSNWQALL